MRRHSINKIVSLKQEQLAGYDIVALTFAEAYAELRRGCPTGDLHIHLHIDAPEEEPEEPDQEPQRPLSRHERLQGMADRGCDTWEEYRGER
jgi:hypothetical protein